MEFSKEYPKGIGNIIKLVNRAYRDVVCMIGPFWHACRVSSFDHNRICCLGDIILLDCTNTEWRQCYGIMDDQPVLVLRALPGESLPLLPWGLHYQWRSPDSAEGPRYVVILLDYGTIYRYRGKGYSPYRSCTLTTYLSGVQAVLTAQCRRLGMDSRFKPPLRPRDILYTVTTAPLDLRLLYPRKSLAKSCKILEYACYGFNPLNDLSLRIVLAPSTEKVDDALAAQHCLRTVVWMRTSVHVHSWKDCVCTLLDRQATPLCIALLKAIPAEYAQSSRDRVHSTALVLASVVGGGAPDSDALSYAIEQVPGALAAPSTSRESPPQADGAVRTSKTEPVPASVSPVLSSFGSNTSPRLQSAVQEPVSVVPPTFASPAALPALAADVEGAPLTSVDQQYSASDHSGDERQAPSTLADSPSIMPSAPDPCPLAARHGRAISDDRFDQAMNAQPQTTALPCPMAWSSFVHALMSGAASLAALVGYKKHQPHLLLMEWSVRCDLLESTYLTLNNCDRWVQHAFVYLAGLLLAPRECAQRLTQYPALCKTYVKREQNAPQLHTGMYNVLGMFRNMYHHRGDSPAAAEVWPPGTPHDEVTLFTFFEKLFPELVLLCWLVQQGLLCGAAPTSFTPYAAAVLAGLGWTDEGQAAAVDAAEQVEEAAEAEKKKAAAARTREQAAKVANERYSAKVVLELLVFAASNRPTWASVAEDVLWQMRDPKQSKAKRSKARTLEDVVAKMGLSSPRVLLDRLVAAARDAAAGDTTDDVAVVVSGAISTVLSRDRSVCGYALGKLVRKAMNAFVELDSDERAVCPDILDIVLDFSKKALQSYGKKPVAGTELLDGFDAVAGRVGAHVADAARNAVKKNMPEQASTDMAEFGEWVSKLAAAGGLWGLAALSDILQAVDSSARSPAAAETAAGAARVAGLE